MRRLRHQIRAKQAMVRHRRQVLAQRTDALQQRTLQALATPKALLSSFGLGFVAAVLAARRGGKQATQPADSNRRSWLPLVRDMAIPLAMQILRQQHSENQQD